MNDMPMFDDPIETKPAPPKKPKPRPTRKRRGRPAKKAVKAAPKPQHHGGRYPPEIYRLIGTLMNLELPLRQLVMEITRELSK